VCRSALRLKLEIVEGLEPAVSETEPSPLLKSTLDLFNGKVIA
jgi:hypothetical protein